LGSQTSPILPQRLDVRNRPLQYLGPKSISRWVVTDGLDFEEKSFQVEEQFIVMRQFIWGFTFCVAGFLGPDAKFGSNGLVKLFVLYPVAVIPSFCNVEGV